LPPQENRVTWFYGTATKVILPHPKGYMSLLFLLGTRI
jgi:hypothetical protein